MDFSAREIISRKVAGNIMDFSIIEVTLKKVCGSYDQRNYV